MGDTTAKFWQRAAHWFAACGIACERVITDNGACYMHAAAGVIGGAGVVALVTPGAHT